MAQLYFMGRLEDSFGPMSQDDIPPNVSTVTDLKKWLHDQNGAEAILAPSVRTAINDVIVPDSTAVKNTDKIVFLPLVGGG